MEATENSEHGQPLAVPLQRPVRPLLERLRERRMLASTAALPGYGRANAAPVWVTSDPDPDCHEAADEIEQLRVEVAVLKERASRWQTLAEAGATMAAIKERSDALAARLGLD